MYLSERTAAGAALLVAGTLVVAVDFLDAVPLPRSLLPLAVLAIAAGTLLVGTDRVRAGGGST